MLATLCTIPALVCCSPSGNSADTALDCTEGGVVGWGDSLTYSLTKISGKWQQADPTWLETISEDLEVETGNFGLPSEGSAEIAIRQGGLRPAVTVSGGQIPAGVTAPVHITAVTPHDGWTQYAKAGTLKMHGSLAGTPGTLQHTVESGVETFSFVPDAAPESAIPVAPQTLFSGDEGNDYRTCTQIIWAGTNNSDEPRAITRDIASMAQWVPQPKRYLIIGTVPSVRDELSAVYGQRFVDLHGWLVSDGLAAAGISPTPEDGEAIAAGLIPPSLRVDSAHFTPGAYTAIGHYIADVIRARGLA
jgi:hypothetical protein